MSAHRRPKSRGDADGRRTLHVRRRRTRSRRDWSYRLLPVAVGMALLVIGAIAVPSVVGGGWTPNGDRPDRRRITHASLPRDSPEQGLVYDDLEPAGPDSRCARAYELDAETCTHGPDAAPAGLRVRRDVSPVTAEVPEPIIPARGSAEVPPDAEIVRDEGGSALTAGEPALVPDAAPGEAEFVLGNHGVACAGDGRTGKRVQVMYLYEFGTPSRFTDFLGSFRVWSAGMDAVYDASAAETGGSRHIRFVTTPSCRVDVAEVQVPEDSLRSFRRSIAALQKLGYNRTDRKYMIFADANVYCGISTFIADNRPRAGNRNNGGPSYGRVDAGCWSATVATHQLTHTLGATLLDSPHSTGAGGCTDDADLLCGRDRSNTRIRSICPKKHENRLDCGHDDYFSTDPKPGSYLAGNWNVAESEFLLRGDGADVPGSPGATVPDASAAPTAPATAPAGPPPATPSPAPKITDADKPDGAGKVAPAPGDDEPTVPATGEPGERADPNEEAEPPPDKVPVRRPAKPTAKQPVAPAPVQAVLEVRESTSTSVRLAWSAAAGNAGYEVSVDGVLIAATAATRARLIGLRPGTAYHVVVRGAAGRYVAEAAAKTAPAARPAQHSWFVLENSLTGGAADVYAARIANGTAVVLGGSEGDAQQQWKLVPADDGTFALQSKATGKCIGPLGGNPVAGTPLVQGDCTPDATRRWSLRPSDHGFTLRTVVGGLVAGIGVQRYGANRLLVLQDGDGSRHQSWTAVPG